MATMLRGKDPRTDLDEQAFGLEATRSKHRSDPQQDLLDQPSAFQIVERRCRNEVPPDVFPDIGPNQRSCNG
jgi:hypothetical protein